MSALVPANPEYCSFVEGQWEAGLIPKDVMGMKVKYKGVIVGEVFKYRRADGYVLLAIPANGFLSQAGFL